MSRTRLLLHFAMAMLAASSGWANTPAAALPQVLLDFIEQHPQLQGRKSEVRWAQRPVTLPDCPQATQLRWLGQTDVPGRVNLEVRCDSGKPWRRQLAVDVQLWVDHWVARRALPAGQPLTQQDFQPAQALSSRLPRDLVSEPAQWEGQQLTRALSQGDPLRLNNLRLQTVIRKGMDIQLKVLGRGFEIMSSGVALSDAVAGASFPVKIRDGKTVQAQAVSEGLAEIRMD